MNTQRKKDNLSHRNQFDDVEEGLEQKNMEEEPEKEHFFGKDIYLFLFLLIVLIAGLSTVSFAFYREYFGDGDGSGTNLPSNNTITTGDVLFTYSDSGRGSGGQGGDGTGGNGSSGNGSTNPDGSGSGNTSRGNGIYITNATPIPDDDGKRMLSERDYFDFQLVVNPAKGDVTYQVILEKLDNCTLPDSDVKVYLTELQGTEEIPIADTMNGRSVKLYSQLEDKEFDDFKGKLLLQRTVTETGYQKKYRLRLWVRDQARDYSRKTFSVKVDIHAFTQAQ